MRGTLERVWGVFPLISSALFVSRLSGLLTCTFSPIVAGGSRPAGPRGTCAQGHSGKCSPRRGHAAYMPLAQASYRCCDARNNAFVRMKRTPGLPIMQITILGTGAGMQYVVAVRVFIGFVTDV